MIVICFFSEVEFMKKCVALLFVLALIVFSAIPSSAENTYLRGDADDDGIVTITDTTVIQRKLNDIPVNTFNRRGADIDNNGVDITDATIIQRFLTGFSNVYNIGDRVSYDDNELPFVPSK